MIHKTFTRASIVILIMLAFLVIPISVRAGGACDSTYTVQWGDTLGSIAETCGTTVSALYDANPGLGGTLYAGQVLTIPSDSSNYNNNDYNNNNGTNSNPYDYNYSPTSAYGTYTVQPGDTFGDIANRYGMSINDLSNANPYIGDQDLLYPGQVINIPAPSYSTPVPPSQYYGPQPAQQPGYGYVPPSHITGLNPANNRGTDTCRPRNITGLNPASNRDTDTTDTDMCLPQGGTDMCRPPPRLQRRSPMEWYLPDRQWQRCNYPTRPTAKFMYRSKAPPETEPT